MIEQIITSSVLIVAIWVLSFLLEKRIHPSIKYALWLLVAVKLLIPLPEFESNLSVINLTNKIEERDVSYFFVENKITEDNNNKSETNTFTNTFEQGEIEEKVSERTIHKVSFADVCYGIWIIGILLCAGVFAWSNLQFRKELRNSRVPVGRIKDKLPIYKVAGITSPCLFGFFRPSIYLQESNELTEEQRKYVLAHEYTHYKHGDHVWSLVRCICVILHWYNPLVWLAAQISIKDSELACDAGTLKLIGKENSIKYGQTLIAIAKGISDKSFPIHAFRCSTSATGGIKEMKKRIQMIVKQPHTKRITLFVLFLACISIVGCTFGDAVSKEESDVTKNVIEENSIEQKSDADKETIQQEMEISQQDAEDIINKEVPLYQQVEEDIINKKVPLYQQIEEDKVCIRIQLPRVKAQLNEYYIPEGEMQEKLIAFMESIDDEWKEYSRQWGGLKEVGYWIYYKGQRYMVLEGGIFYSTMSDEEKGMMELFVQEEEIHNMIQQMLETDLDYSPVDISKIKDIVSATLEISNFQGQGDGVSLSQTITDKETLALFEKWFREAEYIWGGAECGSQNACLEFVLANGESIKMLIATDSCTSFGVNGVYYDYRPEEYRKKGGWYSTHFFAYFDEIFDILFEQSKNDEISIIELEDVTPSNNAM